MSNTENPKVSHSSEDRSLSAWAGLIQGIDIERNAEQKRLEKPTRNFAIRLDTNHIPGSHSVLFNCLECETRTGWMHAIDAANHLKLHHGFNSIESIRTIQEAQKDIDLILSDLSFTLGY